MPSRVRHRTGEGAKSEEASTVAAALMTIAERAPSLLQRAPQPAGSSVARLPDTRLKMRIRISPEWAGRCPKQPRSLAQESWDHYRDGMTIEQYLTSHERHRARRALNWDISKGYVTLQTPEEWEQEQEHRTEESSPSQTDPGSRGKRAA